MLHILHNDANAAREYHRTFLDTLGRLGSLGDSLIRGNREISSMYDGISRLFRRMTELLG